MPVELDSFVSNEMEVGDRASQCEASMSSIGRTAVK